MGYFKEGCWLQPHLLCSVTIFFLLFFSFNAQAQQQERIWNYAEVRADSNNDNTLDHLGERVTITGIANIQTGLLHEHYLQVFVQNDSSGISVFAMDIDIPFESGDSLVVKGKVDRYNGLAEVHADSYQVFKKGSSPPAPKPLDLAMVNPSKYLGMLVEGEGNIIEKGNSFNGKYVRIASSKDATKTMMVYVSNFHHLFDDFNFDVLSVGDKIVVCGIISEYNPDFPEEETYKMFLRTPQDLEYAGIPQFYMLLLLSGLGIITIIIVGWVVMLRRQVDSKTSVIKESLNEKELLLREIHHRVKNSLAIVSGLIELQLDSTESAEAQGILQDSQTRIRSMALIHEKLYQTESLSEIELDNYLKELVEAIHGTFTEYQEHVELIFELEKVELDVDRVIPCGLLVNELVVNAFKHAFEKNKRGLLKVGLYKQNGDITLKVADNGPGVPDDFSFHEEGNLGSMLVDTFAAQLNAKTEIATNGKGSTFLFTFPRN
ncbi:sensor histidine kinase [Fodinibius sp. Rm-B-1B1-1]|uniref:sensor histidine kinase n=1 Tax=Fodinibius alkaliphilus TaxID=3140241 RepID=UPI00315A33BA